MMHHKQKGIKTHIYNNNHLQIQKPASFHHMELYTLQLMPDMACLLRKETVQKHIFFKTDDRWKFALFFSLVVLTFLNFCHMGTKLVKCHYLRTNSSRINNVISCFLLIKKYLYAIFIFHSSPTSRQAFFHCFNGATFNFILLSPSN